MKYLLWLLHSHRTLCREFFLFCTLLCNKTFTRRRVNYSNRGFKKWLPVFFWWSFINGFMRSLNRGFKKRIKAQCKIRGGGYNPLNHKEKTFFFLYDLKRITRTSWNIRKIGLCCSVLVNIDIMLYLKIIILKLKVDQTNFLNFRPF